MTGAARHADIPTFGRALYYPYFRVQDVNWLKAALLYWDEISCIVPENYDPGNPEELKPAEEFILPLDPKPYTERAESTFRERVLPLAEHADLPKAQATLSSVARTLGDRHVWIQANKMTGNLRRELEGRGLLRRDSDDRMFLSDGFDALYMICLAKEMGHATRRPPLTDAREYAECQGLVQFEADVPRTQPAKGDQGDSSVLVELGVAMPSPRQLANVSLESIVEHHRKRAAERRAFRQAVEKIAAAVSTIDDPTALEDCLVEKKREVEQQVRDFQKTVDELRIDAVSSVLDISVPAWGLAAVGAAALAGTGAGMALAGLGVAVKLIEWWATVRRDHRQAIASCPWHYWMDTRQRFAGA